MAEHDYTSIPVPLLRGRVLLATNDRRFRAVTSALLSRRGYTVLVSGPWHDLAELALSKSVDAVLIDATASLTDAARAVARLRSRSPSVGVVAVSADGLHSGLAALPVFPKWAAFDAMFGAIDRACSRPNRNRAVGVH
jgi:CheY-like chemotaxis protein